MAIRLDPERIRWATIVLLSVIVVAVEVASIVNFVGLMGCKTDVPVEVDVPVVVDIPVEVTGVDVSKTSTTTTTVPVSTGDVGGDVWVFTVAGATPWTIAGLVGLLWALRAREQRTATGALDRVMGVIKHRHHEAKVQANYPEGAELHVVKREIEELGYPKGSLASKPDRLERFLRSRLARMKK